MNTIKTFLENPVKNSDSCFNFIDWFCKDSTLEKRMLSFVPKVKFLVNEGLINPETTRIAFRNALPVYGSIYDEMYFYNLNGYTVGGICPRTGHRGVDLKCDVWYYNGDYNDKRIEYAFKTWAEFKIAVKNNLALKDELDAGWSLISK